MNEEVAVQFLGILAVLFALAAAWIAVQRWRGRYRDDRVWTVFGVEIFILAGILVPAYLGGPWVVMAALAIGLASTWELCNALEAAGQRPLRGAALTLGGLAVWSGHATPEVSLYGLPVLLGILVLLVRARGHGDCSPLARGASTLFAVVYPGLCLAHFVAIAGLPGGFGYVVFFYGLAEANDVFAYLIGSALGRRRLWPRLSPNKTLVGSVSGVIGAVLLAFVLGFAVPGFSPAQILAAGLLLAVGGQVGDLFASRIKRSARIKDFGAVIPTQGGVLDVYDAFVLVSPIFSYYLRATGV